MNGNGTLGALSSHGLIEVHCQSRVEKLPRSHKALKMVPLEQSKWIPKLRLLSHSLNVEIKLRMKWPSTLQSDLPSMGGTVTIGLLMMTSRAMSEGRWESAEAWESGYACIDVSLGSEVLTLFGGMRCTDGSGSGEVGGLHVEYRHWEVITT